MSGFIEYQDQQIPVDKQRYLLNVEDWQPGLAPILAQDENIELTDAHWEVVNFVREFYLEYLWLLHFFLLRITIVDFLEQRRVLLKIKNLVLTPTKTSVSTQMLNSRFLLNYFR